VRETPLPFLHLPRSKLGPTAVAISASLVLRPHADCDQRVAELARLHLAISSVGRLGRPRSQTGATLQGRGLVPMVPYTPCSFGGRSPMATIFSSPVNHPARVADKPFGCPPNRIPLRPGPSYPPVPPPAEGLAASLIANQAPLKQQSVSYLEPACHSNPTIGLQKIAGAGYVNASSA
jgi:hypothetical protein